MRTFGYTLTLVLAASLASAQDTSQLPDGWSACPCTGQLGTYASVSVPEGFLFLNAGATRQFLIENHNVPDGDELGTVFRVQSDEDYWFAVFSYQDSGHVDDSDRAEIDAGALLKTLKEGNRLGNEERQKRGWDALVLEGWHEPPFYDVGSNNLTWATRLSSPNGQVVNRSVRFLGRTGVMNAQLVASPHQMATATQEFDQVLGAFGFNGGQRYAEFRAGDKLAGYGLTALVAGGAAAAAVKSGFLQKFWKLIVFGVLALAGAAKKLLFGGSGTETLSDAQGRS